MSVPKREISARSRASKSPSMHDSAECGEEYNGRRSILEQDKALPQTWRLIGTNFYHFVVAFFRMEGQVEWWVVFHDGCVHDWPMYGERWVDFIRKRERCK